MASLAEVGPSVPESGLASSLLFYLIIYFICLLGVMEKVHCYVDFHSSPPMLGSVKLCLIATAYRD